MTPAQAAKEIGCSPQYVRILIRTGKILAVVEQVFEQACYSISTAEVQRYKALPYKSRGVKRGVKRKPARSKK